MLSVYFYRGFCITFHLIVVRQPYDIRVDGSEVFMGNVAFLRCFIPEHVRKFVVVSSWFRGDEELLAEMADMGINSPTHTQTHIHKIHIDNSVINGIDH